MMKRTTVGTTSIVLTPFLLRCCLSPPPPPPPPLSPANTSNLPLPFPPPPRSLSTSSPSTPASPPFIVGYLVDQLGCPKEKALTASKKILHITSPDKPDAVREFLRLRCGLSDAQILRAVCRRPTILSSDVRSNLLPKLKLFEGLLDAAGPSKDLADLVSTCASSWGYSFTRRLVPAVELLRSLLQHDDRQVASAIRRCSWLLTNDPDKVLSRNARLLSDRGLGPSQVSSLIYKSPVVLVLSPEMLDSAFHAVEEELGIGSSDDFFIDALQLAACMSTKKFSKKLQILRSYGFGNPELLSLLRKAPSFLRLTDEHMKKKLDFFLNTAGFSPQALLRTSWLLLFKLDSRLVPRYWLLRGFQTRGLLPGDANLSKALIMPEERFMEEYIFKFGDGPGSDLVQSYLSSSAGKKPSSPEGDGFTL